MVDIGQRYLRDRRGAEMVEWLIVVVLIMGVTIAIFRPAAGGTLYDMLIVAVSRIAGVW